MRFRPVLHCCFEGESPAFIEHKGVCNAVLC